ncbi:MAG TPA: glycosyltransferase [Solirubrobacteraceae bacterium]|nr:glycosyltransferase [Solirubrobacteraceae bacterium]
MTDCDRLLILSTRALQYPDFDPPEHVQVTGARLEDPEWAEPVGLPPGEEPLVLVGLSSTFMDQGAAIGRIAQALGTVPVRGLITTGPAIDPDAVPTPANVRVVRSAPHSEILPQATAMVTHPGHGSVVKALAAGVPMVMMPFGRDQVEIAARAAYAGTGLRVRPGASPARIARAVREVLCDSSYREAAGRAAITIAAEQRGDAAADALEGLAGGSRSDRALSGAGAAARGLSS